MKHFFIITNPVKDPEMEITNKTVKILEEEGCVCRVCKKRGRSKDNRVYTDSSAIPEDTECILVLGGDGTLIEAARDTIELDIPLLGINLGTLGFLAEVEVSGLKSALQALVCDRYELESRMMIQGEVVRTGQEKSFGYALNDIVITRAGSMQIVHYKVYVNGQFLNSYHADGIIISTPTGATGYNLSAGGPIVEPGAKLLVVTPVCPHTLNTRSIILSPEDEIVVEVCSEKEKGEHYAEVNFDGGHTLGLTTGDTVKITRAGKTTEIIKLNKVSFLETLHRKMSET